MNGGQLGAFNLSTRSKANGVFRLNEVEERINRDIWPTKQDPNWANTKFLLHSTDVLDGTVPRDSSANTTTILRFAGAGQGSGADVGSAGVAATSAIFPTTAFQVTAGSKKGGIYMQYGSFVPALQDFTVEMFVNLPNASGGNQTLLDMRASSSSAALAIYTTGSDLRYYLNGADRVASSAGVLASGTTAHITYSRVSGTTGYLGCNGSIVGSWADSTSYVGCDRVWFMLDAFVFAAGAQQGSYFDEMRYTLGTAYYTSSYTVPTARFPDY